MQKRCEIVPTNQGVNGLRFKQGTKMVSFLNTIDSFEQEISARIREGEGGMWILFSDLMGKDPEIFPIDKT